MDDVLKSTPSVPGGGIGIGKEKEVVGPLGGGAGEFPLTAVGQEVELPKEVASTGVSVQGAAVPIPQPVSELGVKPLGPNVSTQPKTGTITLPLSDADIAQGMRLDPSFSWRFLAEWCRRRLKQIGLMR